MGSLRRRNRTSGVYRGRMDARSSVGITEPSTGARVRAARRYRGMTLTALAGLAGMSVGWLSEVERGLRSLDRRSHIATLADALQLDPADLIGEPVSAVAASQQVDGDIPALRAALLDADLNNPPPHGPRPLAGIEEQIQGPVRDAHRAAQHAELTVRLPGLITDLQAHAATEGDDTRRRVLTYLVELTRYAAFTLRHLRQPDLAWIAAERCAQAAAATEDPVNVAAAAFTQVHARPMAAHGRGMHRAGAAADALEPHLSDDLTAFRVYGMLQLSAELADVVNGRGGGGRLREAVEVADRVGEHPNAFGYFGPANVGVWRLLLGNESGDPARALDMQSDSIPAGIPSRGRRSAYHLELGRAYAALGSHDREAIQQLRQAEKIDAIRVRNDTFARDIVSDILARARRNAGTRDLRGLAYRMALS